MIRRGRTWWSDWHPEHFSYKTHTLRQSHMYARVFMQHHMTRHAESLKNSCWFLLCVSDLNAYLSHHILMLSNANMLSAYLLLCSSLRFSCQGDFVFPSVSLHIAEKHSVRNVPLQHLLTHFRPQLCLQSSHYMFQEQVWCCRFNTRQTCQGSASLTIWTRSSSEVVMWLQDNW